MIKLERNIVTEPTCLKKEGLNERLSAHKYYMSAEYAKQKKKSSYPNLTTYIDPNVREALNSIFNGNCAYCESKGAHLMTLHIEHFRPKGGVLNIPRKIHKGYYWLAADWNNLFLSCEHCNKRKEHILSSGEKVTVGKGTYFGLTNEKYRAKYDEDCSIEEPHRLLLNPVIDDVEDLIEYEADGTIKPKKGITIIENKRVIASTQYYALSRIDLQKERAKKFKATKTALENLESRFHDFLKYGKSEAKRETELRNALDEVANLLDPKESSFIGISRQLYYPVQFRVREIKEKLKEIIASL